MPRPVRILVLGGYGAFGGRLVDRLCYLLPKSASRTEILVSGRHLESAAQFVKQWHNKSAATQERHLVLLPLALDAAKANGALSSQLRDLQVDVVVHTSGPFQTQDYHHVASSCIQAGCHYVDVADGREFVGGMVRDHTLDEKARIANVSIITGASTVPALTSIATLHLLQNITMLTTEHASTATELEYCGQPVQQGRHQTRHDFRVRVGMNAGNKTIPGVATLASIMSYCGEPIRVWQDSKYVTHYGWCDLRAHMFGGQVVGTRLMSTCDVPDHDLFPSLLPLLVGERSSASSSFGNKSILYRCTSYEFHAGVELPVFQLGLCSLAWLRRWRLLPNLSRFADHAKWATSFFSMFGTDTGGLVVEVDMDGERGTWTWLATDGHGPFTPVIPASAVVKKLLDDKGAIPVGVRPCMGILGMKDIDEASEGLSLQHHTSIKPLRFAKE